MKKIETLYAAVIEGNDRERVVAFHENGKSNPVIHEEKEHIIDVINHLHKEKHVDCIIAEFVRKKT